MQLEVSLWECSGPPEALAVSDRHSRSLEGVLVLFQSFRGGSAMKHMALTLTPKRSACPTLRQPPQSQSCNDSVTRSMADSDLFPLSVDFLPRYCFLCTWLTQRSVFLVLQKHTGMPTGVAVPAAFPGTRISLSSRRVIPLPHGLLGQL